MSTADGIMPGNPSTPFLPLGDQPAEKTTESGAALSASPQTVRRRGLRRVGWSLAALLLLFGLTAAVYLGRHTEPHKATNLGFISNNSYIDGLYTNENAKRTEVVFQYVFQHLEDEVTVYPSENYYYFNLALRGQLLSGAIHLDVLNIDSGVIDIGFVQKFEDRTRSVGRYRPGWTKEFGPKEGLEVEKVNDFRYAITFKGRTVNFNFYNGDTLAPVKARLMSDEVYVGPSFDESGLRFFLIFNKTIGKLYWVLNEDGYVPEDFQKFSSHMVVGDRTEFAFYLDSANNRKILVGVNALNVAHNNWFDGPFDQLPDNYVKTGKIELRKYLEAHLGCKPGTLDPYGNYIGKDGVRASISACTSYFGIKDLAFVDSCAAVDPAGARLYGALTHERLDLADALSKGYLDKKK